MVMQMVFQEFHKEDYCNCYEVGVHLADLPCGGCKFCTRVHGNWKCFESDVDDVVPLAIRTVHIADDADVQSASSQQMEDLQRMQMDSPLPGYHSILQNNLGRSNFQIRILENSSYGWKTRSHQQHRIYT